MSHWILDIPSEDSSRGYYLGAHILEMLAPKTSDMTIEVPISLDIPNRKVENGIISYPAILKTNKGRFRYIEKTIQIKLLH